MDLNKILNPVIGIAGLLSLALSATLVLAESNETIRIKVKTDDGIAETVVIENLEVGMTEVFVTESGKEVLVTRDDVGLTMEIEGKVIDIKLPSVHSLHMENMDGHQMARRMMFITEGGSLHEFTGEGDHFFSCSDDNGECGSHAKTIWIDSDDLDVDINIEGLDGHTKVFVKRIDLLGDGDIDLDELLHELQVDMEIIGDGTVNHEVIIIKQHVKLHEDHDDN